MMTQDSTGKCMLSFENEAMIRRIPMERRGVTKKGNKWVLGGCLVEVFEEGCGGSAQLYLVTFDEELIERVNVIGVGKTVRIRWHVDSRERYDSYIVSAVLDGIDMLTDGENYLIGKGGRK